MAQINLYDLYSYAAQDFKGVTDGKILVDLKKLDALEDYNEIVQFITSNFGDFEKDKEVNFPNEVKLLLHKEEDMMLAFATQKRKRIFGKCWSLVKDDE